MYIYVCTSDGGLDENYIKALNYSRYVKSKGHIPINPVTMNHGVYDWREPSQREQAKRSGRELLKICDEVWVFGTKGIKGEMALSSAGKTVRYIEDSFRFNDRSEMLTVIFNEYQNKTGRLINRKIMEDVLYYLNEGLSDKLIISVIGKAANVSAGWEYAVPILNDCVIKGITTAEEFSHSRPPEKREDDYGAFDLDAYEQMINRDP